jgi:hypothetical protein
MAKRRVSEGWEFDVEIGSDGGMAEETPGGHVREVMSKIFEENEELRPNGSGRFLRKGDGMGVNAFRSYENIGAFCPIDGIPRAKFDPAAYNSHLMLGESPMLVAVVNGCSWLSVDPRRRECIENSQQWSRWDV